MPCLRRDDSVFVLDRGEPGQSDTENRLTPDWIDAVNACLDEVESSEGHAIVVGLATMD